MRDKRLPCKQKRENEKASSHVSRIPSLLHKAFPFSHSLNRGVHYLSSAAHRVLIPRINPKKLSVGESDKLSLPATYFIRLNSMDYIMEDTQNSAPGAPTLHEAAKLNVTARRQDTQSVTKR